MAVATAGAGDFSSEPALRKSSRGSLPS